MLDDRQTIKLPNIDASKSWTLNAICALDSTVPGCAGAYLRASGRRRQIVHAAFAQMPDIYRSAEKPIPEGTVRVVAATEIWALLAGRERDIIRHYYGECPAGFLNALGKLGFGAYWPQFYRDLFKIFALPENETIARALIHLDRIDEDRLTVAKLLPTRWRLAGLIQKLESPTSARKFLRSLALVRQWSPDVPDAAIDEEISRLSRNGSVAGFIARWARRSTFCSGPLSDSDALRQIRNAADLDRTGVRMRNCLRDQLGDILARTSTYYLIISLGEPVIVHLHRSQPDAPWVLEDFYINNNRKVREDLREQAAQVLRAHGFDPDRIPTRTRSDIETIKAYLWDAEWNRQAA